MIMDLHNKDCMEVMKDYPDNYFDLAVVDPPYGINYDKQQNQQAIQGRVSNNGRWKKYKETNWDNEVPGCSYFNLLFKKSKNQIVWGGNYFLSLGLSGVIIWNKGVNGTMKEGELAKTNFNTFKVFNYSRVDAYINYCDDKIHPTQKPVKLYEWIYTNYAEKGQKILDTHLGSGSNAIAAANCGMGEFVGCEIDTEYFEAAQKRIEDTLKQERMFA